MANLRGKRTSIASHRVDDVIKEKELPVELAGDDEEDEEYDPEESIEGEEEEEEEEEDEGEGEEDAISEDEVDELSALAEETEVAVTTMENDVENAAEGEDLELVDEEEDEGDDDNDDDVDNEDLESSQELFASLTQVMKQHGPIVSVVFLRADGSKEEKQLDMTPSKDAVGVELGGKLTFLGPLHSIDTVVMHRLTQDTSLPINTHSLPPPYKSTSRKPLCIRGDIALVRMNAKSIPVNLTLAEYEDYVSSGGENQIKRKVTDENQVKKNKRVKA